LQSELPDRIYSDAAGDLPDRCRQAGGDRDIMRKTIRTAALALAAALSCTAAQPGEEAEYMRLRPHKERAACVDAKGRSAVCPLVPGPRINKRISIIPGVQHPDFGRPRVTVVPPPGRPAGTNGFRGIGGNRGILGN
jgi:hypothetical protein